MHKSLSPKGVILLGILCPCLILGGCRGENGSSVQSGTPTWVEMGPAPLHDRTNGLLSSGRVTAIATPKDNPQLIYIGTGSGGVWRTNDGGLSWTNLTDNLRTQAIGSIDLDSSDPSGNTLYVGTGEANGDGGIEHSLRQLFTGVGIYRTRDGGSTWTLLPGSEIFFRQTLARVLVSRSKPDVIYAATGPLITNTDPDFNKGLYRGVSADGGNTFTFTNLTSATIGPNLPVSEVVEIPGKVEGLLIGVNAAVTGDMTLGGVYRSLDGGATWTRLNQGLPTPTESGRIELAFAPSNASVVYALIAASDHDSYQGIFASFDGGDSWVMLVNTDQSTGSIPEELRGEVCIYNGALIVDPADPFTIYAGGINLIKLSDIDPQGSCVLTRLSGPPPPEPPASYFDANHPHLDHHALVFDGRGSLLNGNDGGIARLDNPARAEFATPWVDLNTDQATIQFYGITLHPTNINLIYGGTQDNLTVKFVGDKTWYALGPSCDGGYPKLDQLNPKYFFMETQYTKDLGPAFIIRFNDGFNTAGPASGSSVEKWLISQIEKGTISLGTDGLMGPEKDPGEYYPPLIMHPTSPDRRLAFGTTRVNETDRNDDTGVHWTDSSGVLDKTTGNTISSVAYHPDDVGICWAGLRNGKVFARFTDGGPFLKATGNLPRPSGFQAKISRIVVDPGDRTGRTAYLTINQFASDGGQVFKTSDGGQTWTDIGVGLPGDPVECIVLDRLKGRSRIFVGTDVGVCFSADDGAVWSAYGTGFPSVPVMDLQIQAASQLLAAGTHGRGLWEIPLVEGQVRPSALGQAHPTLARERL